MYTYDPFGGMKLSMNVFSQPMLAIDADGVLADFDKGCHDLFGMSADDAQAHYESWAFWKMIRDYRNDAGHGFYRSLDLMPDARKLHDAVKHLKPTILTGCPFGNWAPPDKIAWAAHHFPNTKMITCMARNKIDHMENHGDVLVDDKTKFRSTWEGAGGIFVHHTSARDTIEQLREIYPIWFERTDRWSPMSVKF